MGIGASFVNDVYYRQVVGVDEDGLAKSFLTPQDGRGYYGVDLEKRRRSDLALVSHLRGPFRCEPPSIVESPKTCRRGGIGVELDVLRVRQLFVVKKRYSIPVGKEIEPQTEFGPA